MKNRVLIVGSLNMDVTLQVKSLPRVGETILGEQYYESCGGKGANQAVATASLGCQVTMLGKVGNDDYGTVLIENLKKHNIDTSYIVQENCNTGRAFIQVDKKGNNNIVVVSGCNFALTKNEVDHFEKAFDSCLAVILQNEIPQPVILHVLKKAKKKNLITIYNPAPAKPFNSSWGSYIDYLIVNEVELEEIFGISVEDITNKKTFALLKKQKIKTLIVTVGEQGSICIEDKEVFFFNAYQVKAVDTTAAGDTFVGAFTQKLLETEDVHVAIQFANAASAITVGRKGAQESIPHGEEVIAFLTENSPFK